MRNHHGFDLHDEDLDLLLVVFFWYSFSQKYINVKSRFRQFQYTSPALPGQGVRIQRFDSIRFDSGIDGHQNGTPPKNDGKSCEQ